MAETDIYRNGWAPRKDEYVFLLQLPESSLEARAPMAVADTVSRSRARLGSSFALTLCKVVSVQGNIIEIEKTDAFDGTPVLDIKPFIPGYDTAEEASLPDWLKRASRKRAADQAASTKP